MADVLAYTAIIPKSFTLFGRTIIVKHLKRVDKKGSWGEWDAKNGVIKIKQGLSQDDKEQTFLHELTHAIFDSLNYAALTEDEQLVDNFANLLYQSLKSRIF